MGKNSPSVVNSKTVRIGIGDYFLLKAISEKTSVTIAEALHIALARQAEVIKVSPAQIPMPAFQVTGKPVIRVVPVTTMATNGDKAIVFRIKSRGVRYE